MFEKVKVWVKENPKTAAVIAFLLLAILINFGV